MLPTGTLSRVTVRRIRRLLGFLSVVLASALATFVPASASAALMTIGSPLSVPATLNTTESLGYPGTYTPVPPAPDAPNGMFHTFHYGADTAIWNVGQANGNPRTPATGQALRISLEGCAEQAPGGPPPLSEIHFQDLSPLVGGDVKVDLTSQGFNIPICGEGGASGSTVTTFDPINLCVSAGDYIGFNDEGGYVANVYRSGVPYEVLGSVAGSTVSSFIRGGGTGDGAILSSSYLSADEGFATSHGEELMMQATIGTGSDATHICAGGTAGLPPALPPVGLKPQTDGVNHERIVAVALYCRLKPRCSGLATLQLSNTSGYASNGLGTVGRKSFSLAPDTTTHLPIRLPNGVLGLIRKHHGVTMTLTAVVAGKTVAQAITVKIF